MLALRQGAFERHKPPNEAISSASRPRCGRKPDFADLKRARGACSLPDKDDGRRRRRRSIGKRRPQPFVLRHDLAPAHQNLWRTGEGEALVEVDDALLDAERPPA